MTSLASCEEWEFDVLAVQIIFLWLEGMPELTRVYLQLWWWGCVGGVLSDFVHGGVLASFRLDFAKFLFSSILGHNGKFNFTPAPDCEVRGVQGDFFTCRALEGGLVGLPESACL